MLPITPPGHECGRTPGSFCERLLLICSLNWPSVARAGFVAKSTAYWAAFQVLAILPALVVFPLLADRLGMAPWHIASGTGAGVFYYGGLTAIAAVSLKVRARVDTEPDAIMPLVLAAILSFFCAITLTVHNLTNSDAARSGFGLLEWIAAALGTFVTGIVLYRHFVYYGLNLDRELDGIPHADQAEVDNLTKTEPRTVSLHGQEIALEDD